jgi:glycosyltransferase involved in cell wall biosynthesis
VEAVILAHARLFVRAGYPLTIIAGRGEPSALPNGVELALFPDIDSQHPEIVRMNAALEKGAVPAQFDGFTSRIAEALRSTLRRLDVLIVHNVLSKHFNLALTAALMHLLDAGEIRRLVAWCHDLSWTSPNSRSKVYPGYPWDTLRTYRQEITYVTVSEQRRTEMVELLRYDRSRIRVIYNGVDAHRILGLSPEGSVLVDRLGLLDADLVLLMPVRITQAKNIEFALQVMAALQKSRMHARLVVTGPPDPHDPENMRYYHSLQELCSQLGLEDSLNFVYAYGDSSGHPLLLDEQVVGDLYRVSDVLFMPSHREGFGMPVLEAGLAGIPVFSTASPAAQEIGETDVTIFSPQQSPSDVARLILDRVETDPLLRLRRRVRKQCTWDTLFEQHIEPLLHT